MSFPPAPPWPPAAMGSNAGTLPRPTTAAGVDPGAAGLPDAAAVGAAGSSAQNPLADLETLVPVLQDRIFGALPATALAALSATSRRLHAAVAPRLECARLSHRLHHAPPAQTADLLEDVLPRLEALPLLQPALDALLAAACRIPQLAAPARKAWMDRLQALGRARLPAPARQRLDRLIDAVQALQCAGADAAAAQAAFDRLLTLAPTLPPPARLPLYETLAEALWQGVLGDQGPARPRDPQVLASYLRLLGALGGETGPVATRALCTLLLGLRSLYPGELGPAFAPALAQVQRLPPGPDALQALMALEWGLMTPCEGVDYRLQTVGALIDGYGPAAREAAARQRREDRAALQTRAGRRSPSGATEPGRR